MLCQKCWGQINMIKFFVIQIKLGRITLEQVPEQYREKVEDALSVEDQRCIKMRGLFVEILLITYTVVLPIILGYIIKLIKNQQKTREANSRGTMLLLRKCLIDEHNKYVKLEHIPSYAYENFIEMYEAYHNLGGNGTGTEIWERVRELPLVK